VAIRVGFRRKRKSKVVAPAVVHFTQARNPKTKSKQLCVRAECMYGGTRVGPVWGHTKAAVDRCLATLSSCCDCGRRYHKHRRTEGHRVLVPAKK
jgi:hypothetical protein